jgi:hypothetical protein
VPRVPLQEVPLTLLDVSKFIEWLKIGPRLLLPIFLPAALLLFAPLQLVARFGLSDFRAKHLHWIGLTCLVTGSMIVASIIFSLLDRLARWWREKRALRSLRRYLRDLTPEEKAVLLEYLAEDTATRYFNAMDGVINGLCAKGILFRASSLGRRFEFAYNMQPWAREYLLTRSHLLLTPEQMAKIREDRTAAV